MSSVALVTLGCARNDVDSDELAATLTAAGYDVTTDEAGADVIMVNTCGFVAEAKQESIDTLLGSVTDGRPVIAVGCLAERYGKELAGELPEVDAVVGFDGYATMGETVARVLAGERVESHTPVDRRTLLPVTPVARRARPPGHEPVLDLPGSRRTRLRRGPVAPVKIASGCDRRCAFCAIPRFRGSFVSRSPDEIVAEVAGLADEGVREVILVSENSTSFGKDLGDPRALDSLVSQVATLVDRVRVSYLQPAEIRPTLIEAMVATPGVAPYFDLSFQHASGPLLRRMRRFGDSESFLELIGTIRGRVPGAGIRSNVIVGFPGETDEDVAILEDFLGCAELDAVGVFGYSDEDGTEAEGLADHVDPDEIVARVDRVASLAEAVSAQRAADRIGTTATLLVERTSREGSVGCCEFQGPDDGETTLAGVDAEPGDLVDIVITDSDGIDLTGVVAP
ncbi:MAG: 30S ribosomal protein S12 methylthiotransferase RimO [Candidatus Nanopelagicales bacterium]